MDAGNKRHHQLRASPLNQAEAAVAAMIGDNSSLGLGWELVFDSQAALSLARDLPQKEVIDFTEKLQQSN